MAAAGVVEGEVAVASFAGFVVAVAAIGPVGTPATDACCLSSAYLLYAYPLVAILCLHKLLRPYHGCEGLPYSLRLPLARESTAQPLLEAGIAPSNGYPQHFPLLYEKEEDEMRSR